MDVGVRAKHDSREGGGRAKQDARAEEARVELATWQKCYRDNVAYTEAKDIISFGSWSQHGLEIAALSLAMTVFCLSKCYSSLTLMALT
jgi:hypothetical protein